VTAHTLTLPERLARVQMRIGEAARRSGRDPSDVLLVAVTKTHGVEVVQAAYEAGLRHFGENRVEEARDKIASANRLLPDPVTWHMIGHIQSRKASDVPPLFSWVHSVDRLKVARRLSESAHASGQRLNALLEINLSGEESKEGYNLSRWPGDQSQVSVLCQDVEAIAELPGLRIQGLMTMAPWTADAESVRPIFRQLSALRDFLRGRFSALDWPHLSMGMSGDFEVAIEEGATMIRLGTVLFGERRYG
jgi:pyridoxal phosphate enzyme (YggS family)